jgi:hypothetical protein
MAEENKQQEVNSDADVQRQVAEDMRLNAIVKSHVGRQLKPVLEALEKLNKRFDDSGKQAGAQDGASGDDKQRSADGKFQGKPDPEVARLRQELEAVKRSQQEALERAQRAEDAAAAKTMRDRMRVQLERGGIKDANHLEVLLTYLEKSNLRKGDDGVTRFASKRSRMKGAPAEELEYDDIDAGVVDWLQTAMAQSFLPAPTARRDQQAQQQASRRAPVAKKYDKPAQSDAEMHRRFQEQMEARGVDIVATLRGE